MKIIWVGDAGVSTGFARCTHAACDALHAAGHDVKVIGLNYRGDPTDYPYPLYPAHQPLDYGNDYFGVGRLPLFIDRYKPDVVVLLNDGWNVKGYIDVLDRYFKDEPTAIPPIVGWIAVDSRNQLAKPLNRLAHVMVWTDFAADELLAGGYEGTASVVPLGVDHSVFYPRDKAECRQRLGLNPDAFIVGVVGRNQGRKRLDIALAAFADWIHTSANDDAELFFHVAPTGDTGCNIRALVHYYKLSGRVILSEPHVGRGVGSDELATVYGAFDVLLSTSQAEGFSLPVLEAMACGVPCIVPDFAATGPRGWTGRAALRVSCSTSALTAPMNSLAYTIGAVPDIATAGGVVDALGLLYWREDVRAKCRVRGLELAADFSWQRTGALVVSELERVVYEAESRRRQQQPVEIDSATPATEPAQTPATSQ